MYGLGVLKKPYQELEVISTWVRASGGSSQVPTLSSMSQLGVYFPKIDSHCSEAVISGARMAAHLVAPYIDS